MKFRIRQKGLLVVAIPCVIQVCIILTLAYFLVCTQDEHTRAARRRGLALSVARMVLANCDAAVFIINSSRMAPEPVNRFGQIYGRIEKYVLDLEKKTASEKNETLREVSEKCIRIERNLMKPFSEFKDLFGTGVDFTDFNNIQRARKLRRELWTSVDASFDGIHGLLEFLDRRQREGEDSLKRLKQLELIVLATGIGINIAAALLLMRFFNTDVLGRITAIRKNIKAMESGETNYLPVSGNDEIAELDSSFRAMSEEIQRARENEKALFDNTADIICILDAQSKIASINPAAERVLGYTPAQLDGKHFSEILPSTELAKFNKALLVSKMNRDAPVTFESVMNNENTEHKELLWSVIWSAEQSQWICIIRDISADKQLEKRKRDFLNLIVNDLQKPLHQIAKQFDLVAHEPHQSEKLEKRLDAAVRTMQRLNSLVDNLTGLDILEEETDIARLEVETHTVLSVVSEAVKEVEDLANVRRIEIIVEADSSNWAVDRNQIVRVLVNLLSNAIKFAPDEDKILVRLNKVDETIFVEVEDHGRGIPEEQIGKLFRPFRQVELSDGARGRGSGLGLLTCKKIIEAHHGSIGVISTEGKGSKFWFSIPASNRIFVDESDDSSKPQEAAAQQIATVADIEESEFTPHSSLRRKAWTLVFVPVMFELLFVAVMIVQLSQERVLIEQESLKRQIASSSIVMTLGIFRLGASLEQLLTDPGKVPQCLNAIDVAEKNIADFRHAVARGKSLSLPARPIEHALNELIHSILATKQSLQKEIITLPEVRDVSGLICSGAENMSTQVEQMLDHYEAGENTRKSNSRNLTLSIVLLSGLTISSMVAWMMATIFSRDLSRRLSALTNNCRRFASNQPLTPTIMFGDEISELDMSFRKTANRILKLREKENAFLKNSQSLICSLNQDGGFQSINPIASQILNCSPEQIKTKTLMDFVGKEQSEVIESALSAARQTDTPGRFHCHIPASTRDLLWSVSWSQRFCNFFGIAHDITKQTELERLKREYTAIITHDLRTPLTTVLGTSILINAETFGEVSNQTRESMSAVKEDSEKIIELINDLLDLEKLEAGEMHLRYEPVELRATLEHAREALRNVCKKAADCTISIDGGSLEISADKERLALSIAALLIEIVLAGTKRLAIRTEIREFDNDDDPFLSIKISAPISDNLRAFEKRLANPMDPDIPSVFGSRLRLPLALATLRAHRVTIHVRSEADEFVIELQLPLTPVMS